MLTFEDKSKTLLNVVIALFLPAALFTTALAIRQALKPDRGQDFQWSGTRMVLEHIDPWRQVLAGDRHLILLNQVPNYLHETYLVLVPFGFMSFTQARFVWCLTNCLLALLSLILLGRYFGLGSKLSLLLLLIFFTGQPFRSSLGNGQQDFLELFCFCCAFCTIPITTRGLALGLSYIKYSFSPIFFFYLAFTKRWQILLLSLTPPLIGLLGVWLLLKTPLATLAIEPFLLSRTGIVVTAADLMALTSWWASYLLPPRQVELASYLVGIFGSAVYGFHLARSKVMSTQAVTACLAIASLALMRHGFYDFIFLIVPFAYCMKLTQISARVLSILIFASFWYGARVEMHASVNLRLLLDLILVGGLLYMIEANEWMRTNMDNALNHSLISGNQLEFPTAT